MYRPKRIFLCVGFGGISVRSTIYSKNILLDRYFVGAVIRNAFVANNAIFFSRSGQSTHKILTYIACLVGRKVRILKVDAQSCLYNMLKSDILATFWRIAFENPFNGD